MITANWTEWVSSDAWRDADVSVIPAPPRAFADVFALAAENDVDTRRLMRLVSNDPVFAIRILRLANVAAFAAAGEVMSIELAVVRLGTRAVRNAVLAACLSAWAQAIDVYGRRAVDHIQHAGGTACLARRLAERLRIVADEAFVHGLLHDVGKHLSREPSQPSLRFRLPPDDIDGLIEDPLLRCSRTPWRMARENRSGSPSLAVAARHLVS